MTQRLPRLAALLCAAVFFAGCISVPRQTASNEATFTRDQLVADFDAGIAFISQTHPDLSYSTSPPALEAKAKEIRSVLTDGMTAREAWSVMATVNPVFADAHVGIRRPLRALDAYREKGGALFPLPVVIGANGDIRAAASGSDGVETGDSIISINGVAAKDIVARLSKRMRGESPALGRIIMQLYFPIFFWAEHGGFDAYAVSLEKADGAIVDLRLLEEAAYSPPADNFTYRNLGGGVGYLNITSFGIDYLDSFETFLETAFAEIRDDKVKKLIIDVRKNGGGANDLSDLLLNYLTDQPYSFISGVKARITEQNIGLVPVEGVEPGMVLDLPLRQVRTPPATLANRFSGEVYVLTGAMTYSAAIVFATTVQDYALGVIAGEPPIGPANQTGQVQTFVMPATGIEALAPLYIFHRPNGDASRSPIVVDVPVKDDPLDPDAAIDALASTFAP